MGNSDSCSPSTLSASSWLRSRKHLKYRIERVSGEERSCDERVFFIFFFFVPGPAGARVHRFVVESRREHREKVEERKI